MRITESQLRNIVRKIITEQAAAPVASDSWIGMDDVQRFLDNDEKVINLFNDIEYVQDYDGKYLRGVSKVVDTLREKMYEDNEISNKFLAQFSPGIQSEPGTPEYDELLEQLGFIEKYDMWWDANEEKVYDYVKDYFEENYDDEPSDPTERIFGSEAGYWRYRSG